MLVLAIYFFITQNKQEVFEYSQLERNPVTGVFTTIMQSFTEQVSCKSLVSYCVHEDFDELRKNDIFENLFLTKLRMTFKCFCKTQKLGTYLSAIFVKYDKTHYFY